MTKFINWNKMENIIKVKMPMSSILADAEIQALIIQSIIFEIKNDRIVENETEYKLFYFKNLEDNLLKAFIAKGCIVVDVFSANKITQEKTIAVYIPMSYILTDNDIQGLIMQGLIFNLLTEKITQNEIEFKLIYFNTIEPELLQLFLSKGFRIDMLNGLQTPYVKIDKLELDKPFGTTNVLLRDYTISYLIDGDYAFVEIGHYENGINRFNYTTFEELKVWGEIYGFENILITDKKVDNYEN